MLTQYAGGTVSQHGIVKAAGTELSYKKRGMTVAELATGLLKLKADLNFYYKARATINDLDFLINILQIPVGVEWQGEFGVYADEDNGHYSVMTSISRETNLLTLADPFSEFAGKDRVFTIDQFRKRWWDINETADGKEKKDERMLFLVARPEITLPKTLGLKRFTTSV
jgi:hypothetical protein